MVLNCFSEIFWSKALPSKAGSGFAFVAETPLLLPRLRLSPEIVLSPNALEEASIGKGETRNLPSEIQC